MEEERGGCNTRTGWTLDSALVGMDWLVRVGKSKDPLDSIDSEILALS